MDEYNFYLSKEKNIQPMEKNDRNSDSNIIPTKSLSEDSPLRRALEQPPLKKIKVQKSWESLYYNITLLYQIGRTQEAGTLTDEDILGPCEPGTAINLDGIVWNETKGG